MVPVTKGKPGLCYDLCMINELLTSHIKTNQLTKNKNFYKSSGTFF